MQIPEAVTELLRQIQAKLQLKGETVATAESCTGGLLAYLLTELAGSSAIYQGGVSSYANAVKVSLLGVAMDDIDRFGAVSAPVARAMAEGVKLRTGSTYALALTGIAGPGGGTKAKPVGTVFCGLATPASTQVLPLMLQGDRQAIRWAAAVAALSYLDQALSSKMD